MRGSQLLGKCIDGDAAICLVWQQGGGDALDFASRFFARDEVVNCHRFSFPGREYVQPINVSASWLPSVFPPGQNPYSTRPTDNNRRAIPCVEPWCNR